MGEGYCLCAADGPCLDLACPWCRRLEGAEACPHGHDRHVLKRG